MVCTCSLALLPSTTRRHPFRCRTINTLAVLSSHTQGKEEQAEIAIAQDICSGDQERLPTGKLSDERRVVVFGVASHDDEE